MRPTAALVMVVALAGCGGAEPPSSADLLWTVAIYNRTQAPVFSFREQAACSVLRLTAPETLTSESIPSGVASVGATSIKTPRGYTGTVSVVVTAGASPQVTLGDISDASLPPCQGQP
jgi:hypothetical protein